MIRHLSPLLALFAVVMVMPLGSTGGAPGRVEAAQCGVGPCLQVDAIAGGGIDETATAGGSFDADVVLQNADPVGAFNFNLAYDRRILRADAPSTAGLSASGLECSLPPATGDITGDDDGDPNTAEALLSCYSTGAPAAPGILARVHFTVVGAGASVLHLRSVAVSDAALTEVLSCDPVIATAAGGCTDASVSTDGSAPPPAPGGPDSCAVSYAIDGETVQCADGSRVRFVGVASPLGADAGAEWATALTNWFLAGKTIRLETDVQATDQFGSRYGYAHVTGTDGNDYNLSVLLIYIGMAHFGPDGVNNRYDAWLGASQTWGRTACWNMWAAGNPFAGESGCM
jgi:hypothetical protein